VAAGVPLPDGHGSVNSVCPFGYSLPEGFAQVDVSFRIGGNTVDMKKLPRSPAAMPAKEANDLKCVAIEDLHLLVAAVRHVQELLLFIGGESDPKGGAFLGYGFPFDIAFLHECAVGPEHLDAIVSAIPHVHEAIVGNLNRMHGVELRRPGTFEGAGVRSGVVRPFSVGSPVALVSSGVRVIDDYAAVPVAIRNKHFVGFRIHGDARRPVQVLSIVAASGFAVVANLKEEFSILSEFQDIGVFGAVAGDPDVVLVIDKDAVFGVWPFVTKSGTAPALDQISGGVELEDRRRRYAAVGLRRSSAAYLSLLSRLPGRLATQM